MDITTANSPNTTAIKTQEPDNETRPAPFTNKRRPLHLHGQAHPVVVTYKECLKNHAAAAGGHSVDGCGEFMPSPASIPSEPASLRCAACGCHRNFHRRDHDGAVTPIPALEYHPYHRHIPPPPRANSPSLSPPPISSAYPQHGLWPLGGGGTIQASRSGHVEGIGFNGTRKRFRTKFTQHQKVKMLELAERIGWKMQKRDEDIIINLCNEIGVERWVFKVWMHNNKNTRSCKKDHPSTNAALLSTKNPLVVNDNNNDSNNGVNSDDQEIKGHEDNSTAGTSGSEYGDGLEKLMDHVVRKTN